MSARCKVLADAEPPVLPGGAAPYGNFPNYSCFHPPEGRVSLLPATLLSELFPNPRAGPLLGLDVGCNSGVRKRRSGRGGLSIFAYIAAASPSVFSCLANGRSALANAIHYFHITLVIIDLGINLSKSREPSCKA